MKIWENLLSTFWIEWELVSKRAKTVIKTAE